MSKSSNQQKIVTLKGYLKGVTKIKRRVISDNPEFLHDKYVNELGDKFNPNYVNPNYKGKSFNPNYKPSKV